MKKTRSEGDKSLKEKSKDKSQQHQETRRGPGRPKTVVYEKYDLNQHVSRMMSAEGRKLIKLMTEKFKQMQYALDNKFLKAGKQQTEKGTKNAGGSPKDRDSCQKVNNLTIFCCWKCNKPS